MSNATELLLELLEHVEHDPDDEIGKRVRAFVAAEREAVPVAWIDKYSLDVLKNGTEESRTGVYIGNVVGVKSHSSDTRNIPLYTRPEPSRKPLRDVEIADIYYRGTCFEKGYLSAFAEGFRQAEKHHGIGGGDE